MSKLNLFIDAGNVKEDNTTTIALLREIAIVKNMDEHVESVFVFAKGDNTLSAEVKKVNDDKGLSDARAEYADTMVSSITDTLTNKPNKVIILNSKNVELVKKLNETADFKAMRENALMVHVPNAESELKVLSLFTQKTPTAFKNVQLYIPKSMGADTGDNTKLSKALMDLSKDAARLRGIKVNIQVAEQKGGLFGLFGKKKYDVLAAEIVKKIEKADPKYTEDGAYDTGKTKTEIAKYYGYEADKTGLSGSALKKHTEAKNNYARALHLVDKMTADKLKPKSVAMHEKPISQMTNNAKKTAQAKYDKMRKNAITARGLKISNDKSEETLKAHLRKDSKDKSLVKKGALGDADLIIRHADDKTNYPEGVPCIVYDYDTIKILDKLLTAQFHEPTRLRALFYEGKGSKKASVRSEIKRRISRMGNIDLTKTRKARSSSRKRMSSKVKKGEIVREKRTSKTVNKNLNTNNEAELLTKKAELKKLGFALFGTAKTKKKALQDEIKALETKIKGK
jgi:hypothetical protein